MERSPPSPTPNDPNHDKDKAKSSQRRREADMEAALYTNCLLLGLDASILGASPRSGLFRRSNPRMGEALLHFLLCALRGPAQSAKDFAGVWPILDATQSRDFRKIVQNLINELEAQGAVPRSNSCISSLATCCGQRFVELLWQLSTHALHEVYKRSFPADVALNLVQASLMEVVAQNSHAAILLAVTKARIAIERRRFVESAVAAVRKQTLWSSLAHYMTAEYRALCAEGAYLQQELEKLHDLKITKANSKKVIQDFLADFSGDRMLVSVPIASHLWESILTLTAQHEKLASGPIEDLIAHREHRYRVSGSALRSAIECVSSNDSSGSSYLASETIRDRETNDEDNPQQRNLARWQEGTKEKTDSFVNLGKVSGIEESCARNDIKGGNAAGPLDGAEIIRRWTHALQLLQKQALRLVRSNEGSGPELMRDSSVQGNGGHAQALQATLAEHKQHLANMKILAIKLKEAITGFKLTISALREQVRRPDFLLSLSSAHSSSHLSHRLDGQKASFQCKGQNVYHVAKGGFPTMPPQPESAPPTPLRKLPQVFSMSPVAIGRASPTQRHCSSVPHRQSIESSQDRETTNIQSSSGKTIKVEMEGVQDVIRDSALSGSTAETFPESFAGGSEHFFTPFNSTSKVADSRVSKIRSTMHTMRPSQEYYKFSCDSSTEISRYRREYSNSNPERLLNQEGQTVRMLSRSLSYGFQTDKENARSAGVNVLDSDAAMERVGREHIRPFSPPSLTDLSLFGDTYDDLLGTERYQLCTVELEGVWFNPQESSK